MAIEAELADGRILEFPDGTDPAVIQQQVKAMLAQAAGPQPAQPQEIAPQPVTPQELTGKIDLEAEVQKSEGQAQRMRGAAGQDILDVPGGAAVSEFASAVNRGAINLLDFLGPEQINAALQLAGSETRVPTLGEQPIVQEAITGEFMEPGLTRQAIRTAGEFVAPAGAVGATIRGAAAQIPKVAPVAQTVAQRVTQAAAAPALPEATAAALAGAGSEVGAEVGEAVGGERGRQVGRLAGGILLPIGGAIAKESAKALISPSAKKLLSEAAPTIEGLKQAARGVFKEIDDLGVTVNPSAVSRLGTGLQTLVRREGFNPRIHPKVNAALKEFEAVAGKPQTLSELDVLRRVTNSAAKSLEPDEARLGNLLVNKIDDFLDTAGRNELSGTTKNIGAKYRDARQLWRRAKKSEQLGEAWNKAELSPAGFENGIRAQFRSILKSKKQRKGFTPEELKAMRGVVEGTTLRNMSEKLGMLGIDEKRVSGALMPLMGAGAGSVLGAPGMIAVPIIGTLSKRLGLRLAKDAGKGADLVVRAGKSGADITKAYMKITPPKERTAQELTELLLRPDISLQGLKQAVRNAPERQKRLINDAAFLVNAIKSTQEEER